MKQARCCRVRVILKRVAVCGAACLLVCEPLLFAAENISASEGAVRAAVVLGVIRYTRWNVDPGERLNLCMLGESQTVDYLRTSDETLPSQGKTLRVVNIANKQHAHRELCSVLVVGKRPPVALQDIKTTPSHLLVCDGCNKSITDASVLIKKLEDRITFDVDLGQARQDEVSFSAKMLELAVEVENVND